MKIQTLLETTQTVFYRGVDEAPRLGAVLSSRPRKSIYDEHGFWLRAWDEIMIPKIPALHGTAKRSDCLIVTANKKYANGFGNICTVTPQKVESKITWSKHDFNMIAGLDRAKDLLATVMLEMGLEDDEDEMVAFTRHPTFENMLTALQHKVESDPEKAKAWAQYSSSDLTPVDWLVSVVDQLLASGVIGVVDHPEQVPPGCTEVWYKGTAVVTDFEEQDTDLL